MSDLAILPPDLAMLPNQDGTRLRAERERQGLSMRDLGHFAGCSHTTVQRIESGALDAAPTIKARIARALRMNVRELWPLDEPNPAGEPGPGTSTTVTGGRDVCTPF